MKAEMKEITKIDVALNNTISRARSELCGFNRTLGSEQPRNLKGPTGTRPSAGDDPTQKGKGNGKGGIKPNAKAKIKGKKTKGRRPVKDEDGA